VKIAGIAVIARHRRHRKTSLSGICTHEQGSKGEADHAPSPLQQAQITITKKKIFSGLERSD
jgi:hypothetical protein